MASDKARKTNAPAAVANRVSPWRTASQRELERRMKRDAILQTAAQMFNVRGFDSTSLDDVATMLEVTKPTLYHYFADKKAILYECLSKGLSEIEDIFQKARKGKGPSRERLIVLMERYCAVMTTDFGRCVVRMNDRDLAPAHREQILAMKKSNVAAIREVVSAAMTDGTIVKGDVRVTSFAIAGAMNSIALWYSPESNLRVKDITKGLMDVLLNGLTPPGVASAPKPASAARTRPRVPAKD